jgi:hypothetical protein
MFPTWPFLGPKNSHFIFFESMLVVGGLWRDDSERKLENENCENTKNI